MTCQDVRRLLSLYIDKYLPPKEEAEVIAHIGTCRACAEELAALKATVDALHSLIDLTPPAPPGLANRITARLKEIEERKLNFYGWKRWAAVAAIAITLGGGFIAYAGRSFVPSKLWAALNLQRIGQVETEAKDSGAGTGSISLKEEPKGSQEDKQKDKTPGDERLALEEGKEGLSLGKPSLGEQRAPENAPGQIGKSSPSSSKPRLSEKGTRPPAQVVAQNPVLQPLTFLNKERKINSTYLKVTVSDVEETLKAALKVGAQVGATSQVFAVQNTGSNERAAVRFTVPPEAAPGLVESLSKLGTLLDKREESEDVTARFSTTLEQYREAVAKANAASSEKERQELIAQAQFLEKQLSIWDKEAGEQVIILWLEKR